MSMWLRQSTASQEILLGPFLDDTDGKTAETALTIANTDIKLWKDGTTTEANKNLGGGTHIAGGRYSAVLDATDTNTLGKLEINVHMTGALPVRREYMVLPAVVYDALVAGTDNLDVNTIQVGGTTQTARDIGASVLLSSGTGAGQISLTTGAVTVGTNNDKTGYSLTQAFPTNFADLAITVTTGRVTVGTNNDKTGYSISGTKTTLDALNDLSSAQVNAEVDTALADVQLHKLFTRAGTAQAGAAGSITLDAGASATNDFYDGQIVTLTGGTGAGQVRKIDTYTGSTKVATISPNWATNPDATTTFVLYADGDSIVTKNNDKTGYSLTQAFPTNFSSLAITAGGAVTVGTNNDKTGYSLTQSFPTNFAALAITVGGAVTVGTNNDKTGYSLTQAFPTNFADLAITASTGRVTVGTNADKTGYTISGTKTTLDALNDITTAQVNTEVDTALADIQLHKLFVRANTAQAGAAGSITLDAGASSVDAFYDGQVIALTGGTGAGQSRRVDVYTGATRVATITPNWATTPDATTTFVLYVDGDVPGASAPSAAVVADAVWDEARADHTTAGTFGQGVASVQGNVTGSVNSVTSGVTVTTNNDKTGYSLTQAFPTNFSALAITAGGAVTVGTNNDKTGYSLTQAFPANFADLAITVTTGRITVGTNNDKSGYSISGTKTTLDALNDITAAAAADAVWDEARSGHVTAGTFGQGVASVQGNVTGSVNSVTSIVTANATQIDSDASAATKLKNHALRAVPVTFSAGGTTTTAVINQVDGAAASATNDLYVGRVLIFTVGDLQHVATDITDYNGTTKVATVTAVPFSIGATDSAVMV